MLRYVTMKYVNLVALAQVYGVILFTLLSKYFSTSLVSRQ